MKIILLILKRTMFCNLFPPHFPVVSIIKTGGGSLFVSREKILTLRVILGYSSLLMGKDAWISGRSHSELTHQEVLRVLFSWEMK